MSSEHLQKAKQLVQRGDSFAKQGNYQYAQNCYSKVAQIMNQLIKMTRKPDMIDVLKNKANKYQKLSLEMNAKEAQKNKKEPKKPVISKFGFPVTQRDTANYVINNFSMKPREPIIKNQNLTPTNNCQKKNKIIDKQVSGLIVNNINVGFEDIVGMQQVKDLLYESVIYPRMRPDLFEGIRSPPRGILMYGPPGNGKTLMAKALAKQSGCVFYNLSAASIMNKFVGESQKMLRKVFQSAHKTSPSIIFIDQIDSMLTARSQNQNDSSRRLKTQYLIQFDGVTTSKESHVIVVGATNLPNEIDLAALRRFNKLVYVGLPTLQTRESLILQSLKQIGNNISKKELKKISQKLQGYSASEIKDIVKQVCMQPIRELKKKVLQTITKSSLRKVQYNDFQRIISKRKPLLSKQDLLKYDAKFH